MLELKMVSSICFFLFLFSFSFYFLILDLRLEISIILHIIVTNCHNSVTHVTVIVTQSCIIQKDINVITQVLE